jgi:hypothetical protein
MKTNLKFIKIYFYIIFIISICITFLGNKNINWIGELLFMSSTYPVFCILFIKNFNKFSDNLELVRPDLFSKYKMNFVFMRKVRIKSFSIFNNSDFDKLNNIELVKNLKLVKQLYYLTIISFLLTIMIGICSTFI